MRRLLTWLVLSFGIAALLRRLRRRGQTHEIGTATADDDPAAELRQKLAESRADETTEGEPAEPSVSSEASVEERRASVHAEGRAAVDEMRGSDAE